MKTLRITEGRCHFCKLLVQIVERGEKVEYRHQVPECDDYSRVLQETYPSGPIESSYVEREKISDGVYVELRRPTENN
jgi:hypothetical protein